MSDAIPGKIFIGGKVPHKALRGLLVAIREADVRLEFGEEQFLPKTAKDLLSNLDGFFLCLCDEQAAYGQFTALEDFLKENGIAFDRMSDGGYEWDAKEVLFRPGKKEVTRPTTQNGLSVVPRAVVEEALKLLLSSPLPIREVCALLETALGPEVPALGPFTIV
jgi:hypothetical protein